MKTAKVILLAVVGLLLLADVSWRIWTWNANADIRVFAKQFKLETFHTNDVSAVGIADAKTGKLLLMDWDYGDGLKPGELSYFSDGTNILNVYFRKDKPTVYRFIFHGPDKSETWWFDRLGKNSFEERVFYNTNGDFSRFDVWYKNAWQTVDKRNGTNGLVIDGQWCQLAVDTNRDWMIITNR